MGIINNLPENIGVCTSCKIVGEGKLNPAYAAARGAVGNIDFITSASDTLIQPNASGRGGRGGIS